MIIIADSDGFRWCGHEENLDEWDSVIQIFYKLDTKLPTQPTKSLLALK